MKKSDLKASMVIETRNGERFMLHEIDGELIANNDKYYFTLNGLNNDLLYGKSTWLDIVKVFKPDKTRLSEKHWRYLSPIWERQEFRLNKEEISILSVFEGLNYWLVKNEDGKIFIAEHNSSNDIHLNNILYLNYDFKFLKGFGSITISIDELLKRNY